MRRHSLEDFEVMHTKQTSFRGMIMRNERFIGPAALLLGAFIAKNGAAQPANDAQRAAERAHVEAERVQAQAERTQAQAERNAERVQERASVEQELREARDEMEEAAREVARLSQQLAEPITRQFRFNAQRAMLGIGIEDADRGVRVASVTPNGPAAQAGLVVGDTIIEIEGARLADSRVTGAGKQSPSDVFLSQMANVDAGEEIELRVLNESGAEREVKVQARESSPFVFVNPKPGYNYSYSYRGPGASWFWPNPWSQMQLVTLTAGLGTYFGTSKGLLVVRAPENQALLLRDGDVILDIGGREPMSPEHALRILGSFQEGEMLKITIMRDQRRQTLDVKMPSDAPG
jgi:PDZ domain